MVVFVAFPITTTGAYPFVAVIFTQHATENPASKDTELVMA
jgi:hypothetical protein